jgi:hypothetical protein
VCFWHDEYEKRRVLMKLKSNTEDLRTVLRALFENQSAYESGHELPHRILCVGTGGGFCCSIVAAEFHALQDAGLTHPFTTILTVSGSGGPAGGYLSGVAHRVGRVFEYLATSKFVTWNPYTMSVALDLKHFERALDGSHMPLSFDSKKIRAHTSDFWVTAAEEDGTKVLINAKSETYEPLQAVLASIAVPGTCDPVTLEGRRLVDGVAGSQVPGTAIDAKTAWSGSYVSDLALMSTFVPSSSAAVTQKSLVCARIFLLSNERGICEPSSARSKCLRSSATLMVYGFQVTNLLVARYSNTRPTRWATPER